MESNDEMIWTRGLIPQIDADVVAQILARVSDIALILDATGKISAAKCTPGFEGEDHIAGWTGALVQQTLTVESIPKFETRIARFLAGNPSVLPLEVNHRATDGFAELPVRYTFHKVGSQAEVLLLGNNLRRTAEIQQQLIAAQIALEADYEAQREYDIRLRVLMEASDVATVFISVTTGRIVSCNAAAEMLLGKPKDALIDAHFADKFETKGRKDVVDRMVTAATEQSQSPVLAKAVSGNRKLVLRATLFRGSSSQMLLCKITPAQAPEASADQVQTHMADLFQNGVDSIVFVNASGLILSANEAFLKLASVTHSQSIKGRPIADFYARGAVDLNVMLENARRSGGMRLYATKIINELGAERAVEISTTQLKVGGEPVFAMVIRDSHRMEVVSSSMKHVTDVDMNSVIELIGGQSLKDIVAKSTDVVEKICIETAVQMTSNNRVAAAEMLGLSRQSLYVKLRKYGLINKH